MADESGAIIGAAVNTLGNYAVGVASNRRQFKYQKEAMALQQQYNEEFWNKQNVYNSPTAQMARLKEAGLNPYLVYGGAGNAGQAGPLQVPEVPTREATRVELPNFLDKYLSKRQADAQYAATMQNIELMRSRGALTEVQTGISALKQMQEGIRSKNYKAMAQAEMDLQKFVTLRAGELFANEKSKGTLMDQLHETRQKQMTGIDLDNAFKANRNELAKMGIYSTDDAKFRILIQAAKRTGVDIDSLIKQGYEKLKYLFE